MMRLLTSVLILAGVTGLCHCRSLLKDGKHAVISTNPSESDTALGLVGCETGSDSDGISRSPSFTSKTLQRLKRALMESDIPPSDIVRNQSETGQTPEKGKSVFLFFLFFLYLNKETHPDEWYMAKENGRWHKTLLTYRITEYTSDMSVKAQRSVIRKAFTEWSWHIPLDFVEIETLSDIEISFGPISPKSLSKDTTLGYSYFPKLNGRALTDGDIRIADKWNWSDRHQELYGIPGKDLYATMLHEIGHSIGLDHSNDAKSIMYKNSNGLTVLSKWDILSAQRIYGTRMDTPDPSPTIPPVTAFPNKHHAYWQPECCV